MAIANDPTNLLGFVTDNFLFVLSPGGRKFATRILPHGVRDYLVDSIAFRDVVRTLLSERGETLDDPAFAAVVQELHNLKWEPLPVGRTTKKAVRALQVVAAEARDGRVTEQDIYSIFSEVRSVIEAMAAVQQASRIET
jgi:hypothetical protein